MAYPINVSKEAERDIQTAKCFYRISELEKNFDTAFLKQIEYLRANPFLFQIYYRNVRVAHFKDFKYSIHFVVKNNEIYILRILHQNQKFE